MLCVSALTLDLPALQNVILESWKNDPCLPLAYYYTLADFTAEERVEFNDHVADVYAYMIAHAITDPLQGLDAYTDAIIHSIAH